MGKPVDARSDLYALGIVVYELFTGCVPFHAETPVAVLLQQVREPVRLDVDEAARVPAALKSVLARALAKEPADRFASVYELGQAIARASQAKGVTDRTDVIVLPERWPPADDSAPPERAPRRRPTPPLPKRPRTRTRFVGASLATAMVTVVLLGVVWAREYVSGSMAPVAAPVMASALVAPTEETPPPVSVVPAPAFSAALPAPTDGATDSPTPDPPSPSPSEEPAKGMLRVIAVPWADVSIDGRPIRSPALRGVRLSAGTHGVTLSHPDYTVITRTVTVTTGRTTDLVVDLTEEGTRR